MCHRLLSPSQQRDQEVERARRHAGEQAQHGDRKEQHQEGAERDEKERSVELEVE